MRASVRPAAGGKRPPRIPVTTHADIRTGQGIAKGGLASGRISRAPSGTGPHAGYTDQGDRAVGRLPSTGVLR